MYRIYRCVCVCGVEPTVRVRAKRDFLFCDHACIHARERRECSICATRISGQRLVFIPSRHVRVRYRWARRVNDTSTSQNRGIQVSSSTCSSML